MPGPITQEDIEALIGAASFDKTGLIPVICQDRRTGIVRMFAWANGQALRATQRSGLATFWSRARGELWEKGRISGNAMPVRGLRIDCDGDVVLYEVDPVGPSCHEGSTSCFSRRAEGGTLLRDDGPAGPESVILERLAAVIASRRSEDANKSYVASLLQKGLPKIDEKIREEAGELCEALTEGDAKHIAHEAADLFFHTLVALQAAGVPVGAVFAELARRFGVSGHVEKANRPPKD